MGILIPSEGSSSLGELVYIGGVAYFNRPTKPTERQAGVPLVIGDRWYKTDDGTEWFWNGTYWVSPEINLSWNHGGSIAIRFSANSSDVTYAFGLPSSQFLLTQFALTTHVSSVNNSSNYWTWGNVTGGLAYIRTEGAALISLGTWSTANNPAGNATTARTHIVSLNHVISAPFDFRPGQWVQVGTPGQIYISISLKGRIYT